MLQMEALILCPLMKIGMPRKWKSTTVMKYVPPYTTKLQKEDKLLQDSSEDQPPVCQYGKSCYRKNPQHFSTRFAPTN